MDSKPIITCHGDHGLFSQLRAGVVRGLPRESVEWKRAYGRPRRVNLEANFVPYNPDILPDETDWSLPGRPFMHTFWLESDLDAYKNTYKEEIAEWLSVLKARNIPDWLIVVVLNDENKVKAKLLRTSVYDKVKSDFCSKQSDRCSLLIEPLRADSRTTESWAGLFSRLRTLLIASYNHNLGGFEEHMRAERERRNEAGWNFCRYFLLQEELALMYEMLRLFEDALVQYDELDALFTQYVLNHVAGDSASWLSSFIAQQHLTWDGLSLAQPINVEKRGLVKKAQATLLDFRVYLFSRQCALTSLLKKPWEVAQRGIPFMQNCLQELALLKVDMPAGSLAAWGFVSSLEVLYWCDRSTNPSHREELNRHAAGLWDYSRRKLYEIARVCGYLSADASPADIEEKATEILEGASVRIQKWSTDTPDEKEPISRLKEALSSKELFYKHYLELSELAMGTYKFIGRIRSARMIGRDLATFYMTQAEFPRAECFLQDALKLYKQDGWDQLADHTSVDIAECQRRTGNIRRLGKTCAYVAGSSYLSVATREQHCEEMVKLAGQFIDDPVRIRSEPALWITDIQPSSESFIVNSSPTSIQLTIHSNLPQPITCDLVSISATFDPSASSKSRHESKKALRRRHSSETSFAGIELYNLEKQSVDANTQELDLFEQYDYREDKKTIMACGIGWREEVMPSGHQTKSAAHKKEKQIIKEDAEYVLSAENIELTPGENTLVLLSNFSEKGFYSLSQACLKLQGLEFLKNLHSYKAGFRVICDDAKFTFVPKSKPLCAGVPQTLTLRIQAGSHGVPPASPLLVHHSGHLSITASGLDTDRLDLPPAEPYQDVTLDLQVTCGLDGEVGAQGKVEEQVSLEFPSLGQLVTFEISFHNPFQLTQSLHRAGKRTFIRVVVQGTMPEMKFFLIQPTLEVTNDANTGGDQTRNTDSDHSVDTVTLTCVNKPNQELMVSSKQSGSYVWQTTSEMTTPLSCLYSVQYTQGNDTSPRSLQASFVLPL